MTLTEHLTKASHVAAFTMSDLRQAHTAAINAGNEFAAIAIFQVIVKAAELEAATAGLRDAAINSQQAA